MNAPPKPIPLLDLPRLHAPLAAALRTAFDETLASGRFIGGPAVEAFEVALAAHVGAAHAIGVSSGTDALLAAMMSLGVQPGDEIITSPYTFFATAGAIARLGARPVFADIEPTTFNLDPRAAAAAVTPRTVGIIPVHLFGQCADMGPLLALAGEKNLWLLEDAAQAIGASYHGQSAGTLGAIGTYSFFPAKNLGCLGDGGAVVTNDTALATRLRLLREHGSKAKYEHELVGGNFRLDALQASFLSIKLPQLCAWEDGRRRVAGRYLELLADEPDLQLPVEQPGSRHVFNQFVVRFGARRDLVQRALTAAGIGSAVYYPRPLHVQPCFAALGYEHGSFPKSERAAVETLALPVDPYLSDADLERVAEVIRHA